MANLKFGKLGKEIIGKETYFVIPVEMDGTSAIYPREVSCVVLDNGGGRHTLKNPSVSHKNIRTNEKLTIKFHTGPSVINKIEYFRVIFVDSMLRKYSVTYSNFDSDAMLTTGSSVFSSNSGTLPLHGTVKIVKENGTGTVKLTNKKDKTSAPINSDNRVYIKYEENNDLIKSVLNHHSIIFDSDKGSLSYPVKYILEKAFPDKMGGEFVVSNYSFVHETSGALVKKADIRTVNCKLLKDIYGDKYQIRVQGYLSKGDYIVESIDLVEDKPLMANEKKYYLNIYHNSVLSKKTNCLYNICEEIATISSYTDENLILWRDYLEWKRHLSELRIRGGKYCSVLFEEDIDNRRYLLNFLMVFSNYNEVNMFEKALRKEKMMVFNNDYSENRIFFKFNSKNKQSGEGIELIHVSENNKERIKVSTTIPRGDWERSREFCADTENQLPFDELIYQATSSLEEPPLFGVVTFEINPDENPQMDVSWSNGEFFEKREDILSGIPKDGFIATVQIGDLTLNNRLSNAINSLQREEHGTISKWLFDISKARPSKPITISDSDWKNKNLNDTQKKAIKKMLGAPDVFLCQGPPGTGKTTVIAEAIYQMVKRGQKVLLASQTHLAVNNALEKLISEPYKDPCIRAVRLTNNRDVGRKIDESIKSITEDNALESFYSNMEKYLDSEFASKWRLKEDYISKIIADKTVYDKSTGQTISNNKKIAELKEQGQAIEKLILLAQSKLDKLEEAAAEVNANNQIVTDFCDSLLAGNSLKFDLSEHHIKIINKAISENNILEALCLLNAPIFKTAQDLETSQIVDTLVVVSNYLVSQNDIFKNNCVDLVYEELKSIADSLFDKLAIDMTYVVQWQEAQDKVSDYEKDKKKYAKLYMPNDCLERSGDINWDAFKKYYTSFTNILVTLCNRIVSVVEGSKIVDNSEEVTKYTDILVKAKQQLEINETEISDLEQRNVEFSSDLEMISKKYNISEGVNIRDALNEILSEAYSDLDNDENKRKYGNIVNNTLNFLEKEKEYHVKEKRLFNNEFISSCNVVGISCTESNKTLTDFGLSNFDVVIIDEVSKATPPELLMSMLRANKVVLVGDHRQLPPLFNEREGTYDEAINIAKQMNDDELVSILTKENFEKYREMVTSSLFKEYFNNADASIKETLDTQYRMHSDIMQLVNLFYSQKLKSGFADEEENVIKAHNLTVTSSNTGFSLIKPAEHAYWIDSSEYKGKNFYENIPVGSTSFDNALEAHTIVETLRKIDESYICNDINEKVEVGVISFYYSQVKLVRKLLLEEIKSNGEFNNINVDINTVDRFQGKEKAIIIVSLVRNNPKGKAGDSSHIAAYQRINVAVSRAQKLLILVGAKNMYIEQNVVLEDMESGKVLPPLPLYREIIENINRKGCYITSNDILDKPIEEII